MGGLRIAVDRPHTGIALRPRRRAGERLTRLGIGPRGNDPLGDGESCNVMLVRGKALGVWIRDGRPGWHSL